MVFGVFLGSAGESFALPKCPGSHNPKTWTNCFARATGANFDQYVGEWKDRKYHGQGTFTGGPKSKWAGGKYVGEHKDGKPHGEGTATSADGTVKEGIFENGKFKYAQIEIVNR